MKAYLDELVIKYNIPEFIDNDPVQFPHRYSEKNDIEIVAFLIATIAWGKRSMILNSANKLLNAMGKSPYDFVMSEGWRNLKPDKCVHRTFFNRDLIYYCNGLNDIYKEYQSLEDIFALNDNHDAWQGIQNFRDRIQKANDGISSVHISNPYCENPKKGSACKRLHLALRWLVRNDGIVDLGIWNKIKPSDLMIPLDVHVGRISRELGLIDRKSNDRTTVEAITSKLRELDPHDPIKYDFALFGYGVSRSSVLAF